MTSQPRPSYAYLLHCEVCDDVRRLRTKKIACACGIVIAKYVDTTRTAEWNGVGRIFRVLLNTLHSAEAKVFADKARTTAEYFSGWTVLPPESPYVQVKAVIR